MASRDVLVDILITLVATSALSIRQIPFVRRCCERSAHADLAQNARTAHPK